MTFKEIQDAVLDNCQELVGFSDFSLTKVKHYINRGYHRFVSETRCIQLDIDITTVADQEYYTSSDAANLAFVYDVFEVRHINNITLGAAQEYGQLLDPLPHKSLRENWSQGNPDFYWIKGNASQGSFKIGTFPIVGTSGEFLRVSAYVFPTADLSANGDIPSIKLAWHDALVEYASSRLFKVYSNNKSEMRRKGERHLAEFNILVNDFKLNNVSEQKDQFLPLEDVYEL